MTRYFPSDFVWGTATASYQIEGAVQQDGRGESVWDRFSHTPGKVFNGDTGDVSCDHYHRYPEDISIMRDLGLNAYRFSIAWPRILPEGTGPVNEAGLAFYDRLVDALLEANIRPFVTLYHWDLPQVLQDVQGGWASRAIVEQFTHYADIVSRRLGDRVKDWTTFNEPRIFITHGYMQGQHAPGLTDSRTGIQAAHHVLVAHGTAVPVIRQNVGEDARVGIVYALSPVEATSDDPATQQQRRALDALTNEWFIAPVFLGHYPQVLLDSPEFEALVIEADDMDIIKAPVDFMGVNYYSRIVVGSGHAETSVPVTPTQSEHTPGSLPRTAMGWEIYPKGLYDTLRRVHRDYAPAAMYVTENGAAFDDVLSDGQVHDAQRVKYLRDHFQVAWQAIQDGVPLRGYFVWSMMDNFEWAYGFSKRFGIAYVNYDTCDRTLKDSAYYYRSVIQANGLAD